MNLIRFILFNGKPLLLVLFLLLPYPVSALAAVDVEELLPPASCGSGWRVEGKLLFYDRDTLSERINGEAELYFPYGFDRMAAARYVSEKKNGAGIDVEIYRMGSLLDAFGMFANYRQDEGSSLAVGAESNLSGAQFFLYQGHYFVRIQMTGSDTVDPAALTECARSVALRLPGDKNRPSELLVFNRPEVIKGTERYLPQSLLGYDFLNRGIIADAMVDGASLQIFLLLRATDASAAAAFEGYRSLLAQSKVESREKNGASLDGVDPLYGPAMVLRKGNCFAGALKFKGKKGVGALLEGICR